MLKWIKQFFGVETDVAVQPVLPLVEETPAIPAKPVTTWQERAAAVGALSGPGLTATCTPLNTQAIEPRSSNPLHLRGKALTDFLAQPGGVQRYEAAERTRKRLGSVDGKHYSQYVPATKRLLQAGEYDAAVLLLEKLVAAVDAEAKFSGGCVPPWYRAALDEARERKNGGGVSSKKRSRHS
ncbi:hypothetical protein [Comamonas sp. wu1-DMT]|uniref:hypothetical protein n=1 Tax=Comamonas sp. wu1-DMT TaxID=3126390 RepID=UPI0032E371F5